MLWEAGCKSRTSPLLYSQIPAYVQGLDFSAATGEFQKMRGLLSFLDTGFFFLCMQ